jgi:hypothetical protein
MFFIFVLLYKTWREITMEYHQIPPPDHLKNYICYFWTLESSDTKILSRSFRTVVEGHPGLIFQSPEKGPMYQYGVELPHIFLYGQSTRHADIHFGGIFSTIGKAYQYR